MSQVLVVEMDVSISNQYYIEPFKKLINHYEVVGDKFIALCFAGKPAYAKLSDIMTHLLIPSDANWVTFESYKMSHIARSRLINNLEHKNPELSMIIMGCGINSIVATLKETHVKRTN